MTLGSFGTATQQNYRRYLHYLGQTAIKLGNIGTTRDTLFFPPIDQRRTIPPWLTVDLDFLGRRAKLVLERNLEQVAGAENAD